MQFIHRRQKRLQQLQKKRPEFAELYEFYSHLYGFFEAQQDDPLTVIPQTETDLMRRKQGFPLLTAESLRLAPETMGPFLNGLTDLLIRHGHQGQEELAALKQALEEGQLDTAALFRACLERDRHPLDEQARATGVQPAMLEYLINTALSFCLHRACEQGLSVATEGWNHGYCPLCGGLPAMGELCDQEGQMRLHCSSCPTAWPFPRIKCAYCGNDDNRHFEYFTAEGDAGYRVNICRKCSCYLKVLDARELGEGLPIEVEDINTLHLDVLAQQEGFTRGKQGE